ncbi:hypothetical protein OF83DRAFT_1093276 [Amylostereum chailletii]|nr:hypothetical protein OF83DRAFT_1093276 [Amylostereum chailletii]
MATFSRLQLAAALIEYDNDPTNPVAPMRSAQESAIFAHMRAENPAAPPITSRKSADYLGVDLPSDYDSGSQSPRNSAEPNHMRAPSSLSGLINPFGRDPGGEEDLEAAEDDPDENLEVDLASWGLDSFIPKEKEKGVKGGKKREKEKTGVLPNPHPTVQHSSHRATRSSSFGDYDRLGGGGAFLDAVGTPPPSSDDRRRRSLGSTTELSGNVLERSSHRPRSLSTHTLLESLPVTPPLHSVPFPSQSVRSASPAPLHSAALRPNPVVRERSYSTASIGSPAMFDNGEVDANPFALRPPSPSQTSRFDPKAARSRTTSIGTLGSRALLNEDNENVFAVQPPSPSRSSRFDPKVLAHQRRQSNVSMGSRMFLDNDASSMLSGPLQSSYPRERPYSSTLDLLRPKVLVMPSPLQSAPPPPDQNRFRREGFEYSTDGPPLPGEARSRRVSSGALLQNLTAPPSAVPIASNSFIPNPRADLTLSQLTFRNSLMVGGQRDVSYADIDRRLERATEDGQQIIPTFPEDKQSVRPVSVVVDEPESGRPVGKLYGRSLVDELEARKATMRSKQRVFTGDDRPSMMARNPMKRSTTLIDPATLHPRPVSQNLEGLVPARPGLGRRMSSGAKPLLNFDDDGSPGSLGQNLRPRSGIPTTRSVFGVDTLWEREMAKLKDIESQEEESRKRHEALEMAKQKKQSRKKKKGKGKETEVPPPQTSLLPSPDAEGRVSIAPPVLPIIPRNVTRGPPPPPHDEDNESDSGSDSDRLPISQGSGNKDTETAGWFAGSSDDGQGGPVRTTGVGPRYPNRARGLSSEPQAGEDSEEDLPLAATVGRAMQRATHLDPSRATHDDSDEEKPLSTLIEKAKLGIPSFDFDKPGINATSGDDDDEDDNKPLGLRASRFVSATASGQGADEDEDDKPLGLHPDQQRRTQYQMLVQQQQQHQMMMQAQMHTSMMFSNPSMMGSGFFGAPMVSPMMMPMVPPISGSPPPAPDSAKFNRVDEWRHGITTDA